MNEIWKSIPLPELNNDYQASNLGKIRKVINIRINKNGKKYYLTRIIKPFLSTNNYLHVKLNEKIYAVHRLVLITFDREPKPNEESNHLSGIKTDNRKENLSWATRSENMLHAYIKGLKKPTDFKPKLTPQQKQEILRLSLVNSDTALAKQYNVSARTIQRAKKQLPAPCVFAINFLNHN